jgi:chlorophyll synthase
MTGSMPDARIFLVAALYSLGAHGIMTLNDFKSVEGDRQSGIGSLPVKLGEERAGRFACAVMALPQIAVAGALVLWGAPVHAAIVAVLILVQLWLMARLLESPKERAPWYNATGVTLYVLGMLVTAFALGGSMGTAS